MLQNSTKTKRGDCDRCTKTDVDIFPTHHNMVMCAECRDDEMAAVKRNEDAIKIVQDARVVDSGIELQQDIYNAATVSFVELQAAFEHNDAIPADQKNYALMKECAERLEKYNVAIFNEEAATMIKRNERFSLFQNMQNLATKLRADQRAEFKQLDVNYVPKAPTKKEKTTKPTKPANKGFDAAAKKALYDACKKYNVPAARVQQAVVAKNITPEVAAKQLAELLGLL